MSIVESDERWSRLGAQWCTDLADRFAVIEHIGSTAVPGLAAKPVIDLMAAVDDLASVTAPPGFEVVPTDMPERLFLRRSDPDGLVVHLHVVTVASWPTRNERLLRDHLRAHPADRDRYAQVKRRLMARHGPGDAYTRGKTELIQELTDRARAERGLPSVPVWEE
ncbi:GrpB family protein [Mangrovihabitans endophyticus]|uniref:GrpB family protein n=1 Tax=Mangrovihabitans endophyticus TaxID=1751298 RepID=A0A8J3C2W3_9ACTN|nr:GrpB family protein [Mangrovihabitans endophyticus]GGL02233.1 hypothetical protein GCM10012284_40930 [Mangrovihabitans endophyticus]